MKFIDLTDQRFGKLVMQACVGRDKYGAIWNAKCDCGNTCPRLRGSAVRAMHHLSCGHCPNDFEHRPDGTTVIFLEHKGNRLECIINTEHFPLVKNYHWCAQPGGKTFYATSRTFQHKTRTIKLHHLIIPDVPENFQRDHRNHNGLDNRYDASNPVDPARSNLRVVTMWKNMGNRTKHPGTSSRYRGVSWSKIRKKWIAQRDILGQSTYLGSFDMEEEAAREYDAITLMCDGAEFAVLNFPAGGKHAS